MLEPLFYCEHLGEAGARLTLSGDEARHALAARRLQPGEILWLFDGHGGLARASLQRVGKRGRELELRVEERQTAAAQKSVLHLACALPKGDRQNILLDMATQLGMTHFTPLLCERSVVKPGAGSAQRWQRIYLEACKQSRRLYFPTIHNPCSLQELLTRASLQKDSLWIAHPAVSGQSLAIARQSFMDVTVLVGPEGGFTDAEIELATAAGAKRISLGSNILRIETAAVAALAVLGLDGVNGKY